MEKLSDLGYFFVKFTLRFYKAGMMIARIQKHIAICYLNGKLYGIEFAVSRYVAQQGAFVWSIGREVKYF